MMRSMCILLILIVALPALAQKHQHPQRTATDIARKQTEMLVRELNITDSILRDTIFRMHLKYAKQQKREDYTRADVIQCMLLMQEELKHILPSELYDAFMNRRLNHQPRSPQNPCNWIAPHPHHEEPLPTSTNEEQHTSLKPLDNQPQDHP